MSTLLLDYGIGLRGDPAARLWTLLRVWHGRMRQRRALALLDQRQLDDVGISPAEAAAEAAKPFWLP